MYSKSSWNSSAAGSSHNVPRKSTSFLSLRREKDKPAPPDISLFGLESSRLQNQIPVHPDTLPRSTSSVRSTKGKNTRRPSPRATDVDDMLTHTNKGSNSTASGSSFLKEMSYNFPRLDLHEETSYPTNSRLPSGSYPRARSRTGPSGKRSEWNEPSTNPHPRISASSSTQHTETPPHTPVDYSDSVDSFEQFPVVVAAPVSGVAMMDALVDGMNGGSMMGNGNPASLANRSRFGIPGHHPLYQPPLPTPPPGIVLGGGKPRRSKPMKRISSSDSGDDDEPPIPAARYRRRKSTRPNSSRTASSSTIMPALSVDRFSADEKPSPPRIPDKRSSPTASFREDRRRSMAPSISDIIRAHAPLEAQAGRVEKMTASSVSGHSHGHGTVYEENLDRNPAAIEDDSELVSRSSIDSVADEVQQTLRNQAVMQRIPSVPPSAFLNRHSIISDNASVCSPRSESGRASSIYSSPATSSYHWQSQYDTTFLPTSQTSASQSVAQYLRSARLTTLVKLRRSPHASQDNPLIVSLSDLGSPTGYPVVVFLGLGCVRHIMGLYDEMAECMGLRLITIDRWGLGRTETRSKSAKGIMQWASVVEEVLDYLHIDQCSVMAHSAGAPYALSFANKLPSRIRGEICLLAPWVGGGESSGYKWLKYVPNGILKTAQAAEWKLQAWMIGKPPTVAFEGIGYTAPAPPKASSIHRSYSPRQNNNNLHAIYPSSSDSRPRPSIGSATFSEYDDLGDFDGRFESRSTLGAGIRSPPVSRTNSDNNMLTAKRKTSRGFLDRLKGSSVPPDDKKQISGKGLKALRSMGSLKGKSNNLKRGSSEPSSPKFPHSLQLDVRLELEDMDWSESIALNSQTGQGAGSLSLSNRPNSSSRRSLSLSSSKSPSSPSPSNISTSFMRDGGSNNNYQAILGNALIAASHAESAKGTHTDLLQILNHENHSWGFSYSSYPHNVRVWYGDKDEKIAENAVRWMEHTMGSDRCSVKVVKGADHGLMYRSSVVVDVLEVILSAWRPSAT